MIKELKEQGCTVKFSSLHIKNYGCVKDGFISIDKTELNKSDILGLYGQNGSGKSTFVRAMAFLRLLLCGIGINDAADYIRAGETSASLEADFEIYIGESKKLFSYGVQISKISEPENKEVKWAVQEEEVQVIDYKNPKNKLSYIYQRENANNPVSPATLKKLLSSYIDNKTEITKGVTSQLFFLMQKEVSRFYKSSYIFAENMLNLYSSYLSDSREESIIDYIGIIYDYAAHYFFVINDSFMTEAGANNSVLPVVFANQRAGITGALNYFSINLEGATFAAEEKEGLFFNFIDQINQLLEIVCPGTKLSAKKNNSYLPKPNGNFYDVFTLKDGFEIPIKFESLGIKKIICLITVMAYAYVHPSIMLCIDELDSNIHEAVLEAFFDSFSKNGKGQILFTSNNLHTLEILDKDQCWFTTVIAANRYTRLKYVKPNNNIRNLYMNIIKNGDEKNSDLFSKIDTEKMKAVFESLLS